MSHAAINEVIGLDRKELQDRRANDRLLEELCSDYELLLHDLAEQERSAKPDSGLVDDLKQTLNELVEEIGALYGQR